MEALVPPESEQDHEVLQDDQHADEKQHGLLTGAAAAMQVPLPRVVVVSDDDFVHPFLQDVPHAACLPFLAFLGHTAEGATALDTAPGRVTAGISEPPQTCQSNAIKRLLLL